MKRLILGIDKEAWNQGANAKFGFSVLNDMQTTLVARCPNGVAIIDMDEYKAWDGSDVSSTLTANNAGGQQRMPDKQNFNAVVGVLCARGYPDKLTDQDVRGGLYPIVKSVVRRLTPLECERLQGFPDGWTDIGEWVDSKGKKHKPSDSPRYKALGNSIALPFWYHLMGAISDEARPEDEKTLGSLFDGIGGFPYVWEMHNGKGSAVWAAEIEEFPIAVTKKRFGED